MLCFSNEFVINLIFDEKQCYLNFHIFLDEKKLMWDGWLLSNEASIGSYDVHSRRLNLIVFQLAK